MLACDTPSVLPDAAVVAALNARTGKIEWRQALPEAERLDALLLHRRSLFTLSVSDRAIDVRVRSCTDPSRLCVLAHTHRACARVQKNGKMARMWHAQDGAIAWDALVYSGDLPPLSPTDALFCQVGVRHSHVLKRLLLPVTLLANRPHTHTSAPCRPGGSLVSCIRRCTCRRPGDLVERRGRPAPVGVATRGRRA